MWEEVTADYDELELLFDYSRVQLTIEFRRMKDNSIETGGFEDVIVFNHVTMFQKNGPS